MYVTILLIISTFIYYFFPLLYHGENAVVRVEDCLDGDFAYRIVLAKSHTIFAFNPMTPVNNIMNGLPRACLPSGLNIYQWIVFLFPNFYAFLINYIIVHLLGFFGMFFFLRNHVLKENAQKSLALLVALAFAILPVYTTMGMAVIGMPFLLNILLLIQQGKGKAKHYLAIIFFAFYCYHNMFPLIVGGVFIFFIWDLLRNHKFNLTLFLAIGLLVTCLAISEYQMVYTFVFHKIVPHRLVVHYKTSLNYKGIFVQSLITLFNGEGSSSNYPVYIVGLSLLLIIVSYFLFKPSISFSIKFFLLAFIVSLGFAVWDWYGIQFLYDKYRFFNVFSFKRIYCFLPFLVYALLGSAMGLADQKLKWLKFILVPVILVSTLKINYDFDHSENTELGNLTYRQFFSERMFNEIDAYIGKPKQSYRICDIGLIPAISQYNGFYTLDGYQYLYPMPYRGQFIKIIQGELDKSPRLVTFFTSQRGGANVCYTFSSELYDANEAGGKIAGINNMALNYDALKSMNCQYIFSLYNIKSFTSDKIVFDKKFSNQEALFDIYLYKVL